MSMPLFYDVEPPPACGCEGRGCARQRLADSTARNRCRVPGSGMWAYLAQHGGRGIPAGPPRSGSGPAAGVPRHPGTGTVRPGRGSGSVLTLGRRLAARGLGAGCRPSRNAHGADFPRARGRSGRSADGDPGSETGRRLFP